MYYYNNTLLPFSICQYRTNELNYDINLAYEQSQNGVTNPAVPQLQVNQAYTESQHSKVQNSDEPIYERLSDMSRIYAQILALEGDKGGRYSPIKECKQTSETMNSVDS